MTGAVLSSFPKRTMRVRKTGVVHPFVPLFAAVLCCAVAWALAAYQLPEILETWKISREIVEVPDARLSGATCSTRKFVMISCKANVSYKADGRPFSKNISFSYVDLETPPGFVGVVRSSSDPSLATLDVAVDKIWHQIGAFAFAAGVLNLLAAAGLVRMVRAMWARRAVRMLGGSTLRPIVVEVKEISDEGYFSSVVKYQRQDQKPQMLKTQMGRKERPFYLSPSSSCALALAVTDEREKTVLLLDEKLKRLDFSKAERNALYEARTQLHKAQAAA